MSEDYKYLMEFCIHCGHNFSNLEYAYLYARYWSVTCGQCGQEQNREEYRHYFEEATGENLGPADATI